MEKIVLLTAFDIEMINARKDKIYDKFFYRFYDEIFYYSFKSVLDTQEAEDIALKSLENTWLSPEQFENEGNVKAYLMTIARNECINANNAKKRLQIKLKHYKEQRRQEESDLELHEKEAEIIKRCIDYMYMLKNRHGEFARLHYEEGLSYKEIAGKFGISVNGVAKLKDYAVKKIKELMNQKFIAVTSITIILTTYSQEVFKKISGFFSLFIDLVVFLIDK